MPSPTLSKLATLVSTLIFAGVAFVAAASDPYSATTSFPTKVLLALFAMMLGALLWISALTALRNVPLRLFADSLGTTWPRFGQNSMPLAIGGVVLLVVLWFASAPLLKALLSSTSTGAFEAATKDGATIVLNFSESERNRLRRIGDVAAQVEAKVSPGTVGQMELVLRALTVGADAAWTLNAQGGVRVGAALQGFSPSGTSFTINTSPLLPELQETLTQGLEVWEVDDKYFLGTRVALSEGHIVAARRVTPEWIAAHKRCAGAIQLATQQRGQILAERARRLVTHLYLVVFLVLAGLVLASRGGEPPEESEDELDVDANSERESGGHSKSN